VSAAGAWFDAAWAILEGLYATEGECARWLESPQALLGGRVPAAVINAGGGEGVLDCLRSLLDCNYT